MVDSKTRRSSRLIRDSIILVIVITIIFLLFNFLGVFNKTKPSPHTLEYRVTGSSSVARITYTEKDGSTNDVGQISIPWKHTIKAKSSLVVILTAGNPSQVGTITCSLILDGREWKTDTANAPGDKVSCAGIVP